MNLKFWEKKKTRPARRKLTASQAISINSYRRGYAAAKTNRLYADWPITTGSANQEIKRYLDAMRARIRHLARNNDYARRFLNMVKSNVIGPDGIIMQSRAINSNGKLDDNANSIIESGWKEWGKKGVCTANGKLSWIDAQKLFIESLARDGESLVQKHFGWTRNRFNFAISFIEPALLETEYEQILPNGNIVRMSVELDKFGRPVAYHFLTYNPEETFIHGYTRASRERIKADEIIHAFITEYPDQVRGFPWMHTAGKRLHMLDGYEEAELVAARAASAKMGFLTSGDGEGYTGDGDLDTGDLDSDEELSERGSQKGPVMHAEPGTIPQLPDGVGFTQWDPQHPTTAFPEFEKALLRGTSSGLNVSYVGLANNLQGVNLSSIRQGSLDEQEMWKELQNYTIETFCSDVKKAWLLSSLNCGAINLPMAKISKFSNTKWQPRRWKRVDPQKENNSNKLQVENGVKSLQDWAGENGRDLEEIFIENMKAMELAKKYKQSISIFAGGKDAGTN